MIAHLSGNLKRFTTDGLILDVHGVGYDVVLPPVVRQALEAAPESHEALSLWISAQASRDQPLMTLFGFLKEEEKEFWSLLTTVQGIGNRAAARLMIFPINTIAQAIQEGNQLLLDNLPGVSARGAERIIAALRAKVQRFAQLEDDSVTSAPPAASDEELRRDAAALLVQMGLRPPTAAAAVERILEAQPSLERVEDIVTEYFKSP